ncbi:Protein kinase domain-containing protein [Trichostrongylus colubriformis]|uniref:Protein kinase domain-containing protein n=1 Tax=Trichostrongylus colubriformis TaxID=6319 RepID=A0AAN8FK18_TRICO
MSFDLESCEHSSSSCSIDDKLPSTNNLIRGKEGQYAVGRKLAQGRYGAVYEVLRKSDGKPFACKLEICGSSSHGLDMDYVVMNQATKRETGTSRHDGDDFENETRNLLRRASIDMRDNLLQLSRCNHLVKSIDRGKIEDHFKFLIMPLCSNFCLAPNSSRGDTHIFLIDYGVCRAYKDKSGNVKEPREQVRFRGTTRYASLSAHNGEEQSPRDDLVSWFYMMVEMLSGFLPWSHFHRDSLNEVEFRRLQKYIDGLKFHSQPDYTFIAEMVQLAMKNNGVKMDEPYDWED